MSEANINKNTGKTVKIEIYSVADSFPFIVFFWSLPVFEVYR